MNKVAVAPQIPPQNAMLDWLLYWLWPAAHRMTDRSNYWTLSSLQLFLVFFTGQLFMFALLTAIIYWLLFHQSSAANGSGSATRIRIKPVTLRSSKVVRKDPLLIRESVEWLNHINAEILWPRLEVHFAEILQSFVDRLISTSTASETPIDSDTSIEQTTMENDTIDSYTDSSWSDVTGQFQPLMTKQPTRNIRLGCIDISSVNIGSSMPFVRWIQAASSQTRPLTNAKMHSAQLLFTCLVEWKSSQDHLVRVDASTSIEIHPPSWLQNGSTNRRPLALLPCEFSFSLHRCCAEVLIYNEPESNRIFMGVSSDSLDLDIDVHSSLGAQNSLQDVTKIKNLLDLRVKRWCRESLCHPNTIPIVTIPLSSKLDD